MKVRVLYTSGFCTLVRDYEVTSRTMSEMAEDDNGNPLITYAVKGEDGELFKVFSDQCTEIE